MDHIQFLSLLRIYTRTSKYLHLRDVYQTQDTSRMSTVRVENILIYYLQLKSMQNTDDIYF